jgi:DnaJ-class molecular chaperone
VAPRSRSFYDTLGIDSSATAADIKRAYFDLCKKVCMPFAKQLSFLQHHPDVPTTSGDPNIFLEINQAYEVSACYGILM